LFRGNAIPEHLTGEALWLEYAQRVVDLGRVLKDDGWENAIAAVPADTDAKAYAVSILRLGMDGDAAGVAAMIRKAVNSLWSLGLSADTWLREELMYEVLGLLRPPDPPLNWEGQYLEAVETLEEFVRWIDLELAIPWHTAGRGVRNAYRLVDRLGLLAMPEQPVGPLNTHQEEAVLRNLLRECRRRLNIASDAAPAAASENERKFMELAIEEARKSVGEGGRAHPKVGAVIVKDGIVVASAHRGEMGKGDHAEYTALEKKLAEDSIAGATVYTTLEPCTTRKPPKIPCAERLIERKVKRVVIGVLDPNPAIRGNGQLLLRKHNIEVTFFLPDLMAEIEELNRDFTRAQSQAGNG
jgi:pyrimidine deaminase RibD-like protein